MAQLNTGNLGGGITHTFEFDYNDLQTDGFLSTNGALTGSTKNPAQVFGADNQKVVMRIPKGSFMQIAGLTTVEATAGASDLTFYCNAIDENAATLNDMSGTTSALLTQTELDNRVAGYSLVNNGNAYGQTLANFITNSDSGLDGLTGGTDAENGAAAALALYNNRTKNSQERSYAAYAPAQSIADTIYIGFTGSISSLTAGRWILYFQLFDPISLINGKKPDALA
jgi:hypothetical protein